MFKYRILCGNKENILSDVNQIMAEDLPCGKSIFGGDLHKSGIHFTECDENIKGFYLAESENRVSRGSPIRVCFKGKFTEDEENLYFEVYIYPRVFELLFLIFALIFLSVAGKVSGLIIAIIILSVFAKGYYDMMKETYNVLSRIFK